LLTRGYNPAGGSPARKQGDGPVFGMKSAGHRPSTPAGNEPSHSGASGALPGAGARDIGKTFHCALWRTRPMPHPNVNDSLSPVQYTDATCPLNDPKLIAICHCCVLVGLRQATASSTSTRASRSASVALLALAARSSASAARCCAAESRMVLNVCRSSSALDVSPSKAADNHDPGLLLAFARS